MQLLSIIIAAALGLIYGQYNYGFLFSSKICLFAGLTLIMPTLFSVKFSDIKLAYEYKSVMLKGLILNYIVLPIIAVSIGLLTHNFGIAAGLFLLSVLSGGGMVMHWIKVSNADTSIGFVILFMNLLFVSLSLLMLHIFGIYTSDYFGEFYSYGVNMSNFAKTVIILLIIVPFIASRIVMLAKPLQKFITDYRSYISKISIFIIVFYLFGLQNSQTLFEIYEFEPELILNAIIASSAFYSIMFFVSKYIYNLDSMQERAAFWQTITRYITLALVISTFTSETFGASMILPIMFAYIIQIPFSAYVSKIMFEDKEELS